METPDGWVIMYFTLNGEQQKKIFASWSGSYLYGSSWRLSSKIITSEETETAYVFTTESGNKYQCSKNGKGRICAYNLGILEAITKNHNCKIEGFDES